eukprot:1158231-Pelagomonas_calceolata.AAC.4
MSSVLPCTAAVAGFAHLNSPHTAPTPRHFFALVGVLRLVGGPSGSLEVLQPPKGIPCTF